MKNRVLQSGKYISLLFTLLLFLVFLLSAVYTVLIGSRVFARTAEGAEDSYNGTVLLAYAANKIRQGDREGEVSVNTEGGTSVLELRNTVDGREYLTQIYYMDGYIMELFTGPDFKPGLESGQKIVPCRGIAFEQQGSLIRISADGGREELYVGLRCKGAGDGQK